MLRHAVASWGFVTPLNHLQLSDLPYSLSGAHRILLSMAQVIGIASYYIQRTFTDVA